MNIEFDASLWKVNRDHEDETKVTLCCDCSQIDKINSIPALKLLKVKIEVEE